MCVRKNNDGAVLKQKGVRVRLSAMHKQKTMLKILRKACFSNEIDDGFHEEYNNCKVSWTVNPNSARQQANTPADDEKELKNIGGIGSRTSILWCSIQV